MDLVAIAQEVLDKALSVTMRGRTREMTRAFDQGGISLSEDGKRVESVRDEGSFAEVGNSMRSPLPTTFMVIKRLLGTHGISI